MFHQSPKLFTDPNVEYPINNLDLHFTDYISQSKKIIAETRVDLTKETEATIIEANAPFELKPEGSERPKYGALLIHGLLDSPFHLRDIATQLQKQGIWVRSILLPGHGLVPGALLNVQFEQWLAAVRYGIHSLGKEVEKIFLVGDSTGASLALHESKYSIIAGIILISPAFKIRSRFAPYSNGYRYFTPYFKKAPWLFINNQMNNYVKYTSIPLNAVHQVYRLTQAIKNQPPCALPLLFALSRDDKMVCAETSLHFFQTHSNPKSKLILYTTQTSQFEDRRIIIRSSAFPDMNIINFSHICIPIQPKNIYYGMNGAFAAASHVYEKTNTIYGEFTRAELKFKKMLYQLGLTKTRFERLTFNPDFEFMQNLINQFIHSI